MTKAELQRKKSRLRRAELKQIEAVLHPCPRVKDVDILHEHRGTLIVFSAWRGETPLNERRVHIPRIQVLCLGRGLDQADINFLLEQECSE